MNFSALLERKGENFVLLVTSGFKDICAIGTQARPRLFDLNIRKPGVLYQTVVEINERVTIDDVTLNPFLVKQDLNDPDLIRTESGEVLRIIEKLDEKTARKQLKGLYEEGYRSVAICLMHSHVFPGQQSLHLSNSF